MEQEKLFTESEAVFTRSFLEALNTEGMTEVDASDIANVYCILKNADKHYPLFRKLSEQEKIVILRKAYVKGFSLERVAKRTFDLFVEEGLDKEVIKFDINLNKYKHLFKIKANSRKNGKPTDAIQCIEFYWLTQDGKKIRTTIHVSDLWLLLSSNRDPMAKLWRTQGKS